MKSIPTTAYFVVTFIYLAYIFFYRRKKKDSHLNGVKHGILLAPILFIWAFQIISPVFYMPAFPDKYEMIRTTISFTGFILFLLYIVIVEILINNGKLSWFLRKKESNKN